MISRWTAALGGLFLVAMTAIITWGLATGAYGGVPGARGLARRLLNSQGFVNLAKGLAIINTQAYAPTDPHRLTQAALQGAVAALGDPYSSYLAPAAYQALQSSASGSYVGIGIEVEQDADGYPVVVRVFAGSPAAAAAVAGEAAGAPPGLRAGDRILSVDGQSVRGVDKDAVRNMIVGQQGTQVTLEVQRPVVGAGGGAPGASAGTAAAAGTTLRFILTREPIQITTVTWAVLPGSVGYLDIRMFNQQTPAQMQAAVAALRGRRVRAIVVDLRDNPGGLLDSAEQVGRYLLPGGVLAYLQPRAGARQAIAVPTPQPLGVPYDVLIDGYTASAAELLAGAVQDDAAAPLIGERTFGKGSVQRVFPLAGGAALKLTVAHYLTPKGRDLNGVGVVPDRVVPFPDQTPEEMGNPITDPQLAAAVAVLAANAA